MLTTCFDGSGKYDSGSPFVTLAAVAADDLAWDHFNHHWREALDQHGVDHLHMKNLLARNEPYVGWSDADIAFLMQKLSLLPSYITSRGLAIHAVRFSMDAQAHRKWGMLSNACSPAENLALGAFYKVFQWYARLPQLVLEPMVLLFDRDEPYLHELKRRRDRRSNRSEKPWWHFISSIDPVDSKKVYGVQAADMLAWSYNRLRVEGKNDLANRIANLVMSRVPHVYNEVEEVHFRKVRLPGEMFSAS